MPRIMDGWAVLNDVVNEAGYASRRNPMLIDIVRAMGVPVELRQMHGSPPGYMIPIADAPAVTDLLKEQRARNVSEEEVRARISKARIGKIQKEVAHGELAKRVTEPVSPPKAPALSPSPPPVVDRPPMGFQAPKSREQEFTEACRKLVHLCRVFDDDREVVINSDGAELRHTVKVEKTEKIDG